MLFGSEDKDKNQHTTLKMSYSQVLNALDTLAAYPQLAEYIKSFNGNGGFMFTVETQPQRKAYQKQLSDLLDSNGMHSGSSWACLLRGVQAILMGVLTREWLLGKIAEQNIRLAEYQREYARQAVHEQALAAAGPEAP